MSGWASVKRLSPHRLFRRGTPAWSGPWSGVRLFGLMCLLIGGDGAMAASFIKLHVEFDGSADPPGDRIDLDLLWYPGDTTLAATVTAVRLIPPPGVPMPTAGTTPWTERPIRAAGERHRAADGRFMRRDELTRFDEEPSVRWSFAIPYADLQLPAGRHHVAYEVEVREGDEVQFTAYSEVSLVTVGPRARPLTQPVMTTVANPLGEQPLIGLVPEFNDGGSLREIIAANTLVTATPESAPLRIPTEVMIAGGYAREAGPEIAAPPPDDPINPGVRHPANAPWVPQPNVTIYFGTNRQVVRPTSKQVDRYGDALTPDLTYGTAQVSIPLAGHHRGTLERPRWYESPDPRKHFLVEPVTGLEHDVFLRTMRSLVGEQGQDTFVFVHGFNVTFEWSILTAARLKHDIRFAGPMLAFSWASEGRSFDLLNPSGPYRRDEAKAAGSIDHLATFLTELDAQRREQAQPGRIHLLAHSMGNRVLLGALERLSLRETAAPKFGHVIFAAPDIDATTFVNQYQRAHRLVESTTLYFCDEDQALKLSQRINNDARVGQRPIFLAPPRFEPPLHNIDCAKANTSWLGHGYITDRDILLVDLEMLINLDRKPDARCPPLVPGLIPAVADRPLWLFP